MKEMFKCIYDLFFGKVETIQDYAAKKPWRKSIVAAIVFLLALDIIFSIFAANLRYEPYTLIYFLPLLYAVALFIMHWSLYLPVYLFAPEYEAKKWHHIWSSALVQQLTILVLSKLTRIYYALVLLLGGKVASILSIFALLAYLYLLYKPVALYVNWYRSLYSFKTKRAVLYAIIGFVVYIVVVILLLWLASSAVP